MSPSASGPILLFDGECGLCKRAVDFVLRHDERGAFRFASLQSPAGMRLRADCGIPPSVDTLLVVEGRRAWIRSGAVLRVARLLGAPWSWLGVLALVPRPLRDCAYGFLARRRLRLFGRTACRVPSPSERGRFLES